jgi:hypothetical protein
MPHVLMANRLFLFHKEQQGGGVDSQNCPHWALDFPLTHILSLKLLINFVFSDTTSETTKRKYIANCTKKIKQKFIMGDSRTPRDSILPRKESRP